MLSDAVLDLVELNMMNGRNVRESLLGSLNHHRRGHSFNGVANNNHDDNLDLFSNNRRSLSLASSDESSDGDCFACSTLFLISPPTLLFYASFFLSNNNDWLMGMTRMSCNIWLTKI